MYAPQNYNPFSSAKVSGGNVSPFSPGAYRGVDEYGRKQTQKVTGGPMPTGPWQQGGYEYSPRSASGAAAQTYAWDENRQTYVDRKGKEVSYETVLSNSPKRTSLQNTERYQGDNFLRGLEGVDQLGAYDAETRRSALTGLMGAFGQMMGGGGGGGGGFNITGPGGPVASLNYNTSINPQQQVFNPQQGAGQMHGQPAHYAGTPGQAAFANNYAGMGQANANQFQRSGAQNQNQYFNQAQTAQNQGALQGLRQGVQQQGNARGRQNRAFGMVGGMMQDFMQPMRRPGMG